MTWTKATTNPAGIDPGTERSAAAGRILLVGTLLAGLALLVWLGRNSIPSWFATSHTTDIWLTWWDEQDDARVKRAFATAKRSLATDAVLEFDSAQLKHIRNGIVHVPHCLLLIPLLLLKRSPLRWSRHSTWRDQVVSITSCGAKGVECRTRCCLRFCRSVRLVYFWRQSR
jgi:hypothetical protein